MARGRLLALLCCLPLAACSVDPPLPLEQDPACAALRTPPADIPGVAVAPVRLSYRGAAPFAWRAWRPGPIHAPGPEVIASAAPVDTAAPAVVSTAAPEYPFAAELRRRAPDEGQAGDAPAPLPPREYSWDRPDLDLADLTARVTAVASLALGRPALTLAAGRDAPSPQAAAARLRDEADDRGATLIVAVDLQQARVAWVERDGLLWWFDAFMFWVPGIYPIVLVPDEVFEVALRARVDVVHARSGASILSREFVGAHAQALNEPQRGWSLAGLLYLDPYFLDEDDYRDVLASIGPHAQADLERQVATWLHAALPSRLAEPEVRELLRMGDPAQARTYAIVIGAPGPRTDDIDRPRPLRSAIPDAGAVADLLGAAGAPPERVARLSDPSPAAVLEAVERLGARMLGHDRLLIYYSGYGRTDAAGAPALVLEGGATLAVARLNEALRAVVPARSEVGLLLDTSFGGVGGRTYPGGAPPAPDALEALVDQRAFWWVLSACGPDQVALDGEERGLFTRYLLNAAQGPADGNDDRRISVQELQRYLLAWMPGETEDRVGSQQVPALHGRNLRADVFLVPPRAE